MSDFSDVKRLAEAIESCTSISAADESAWMRRTTGEKVLELFEEMDELKAEIERLRTAEGDAMTYKAGMENVAQQRDQLKAEVESLRKINFELRGAASCENLHHCLSEQHCFSEPCKVLARIDAAMTK